MTYERPFFFLAYFLLFLLLYEITEHSQFLTMEQCFSISTHEAGRGQGGLKPSLSLPTKNLSTTHSNNQPQPTPPTANLTHLTHFTHGALVLGLVLDAIEGTRDGGLARVDGGVARGADGEFREGVEVDLNGVCGARALGGGLDAFGLWKKLNVSIIGTFLDNPVRKTQRTTPLLTLLRKVHGAEQRERAVLRL
ncbi:hypothetical protein KC330_g78 [Hortaea werneckii]|nr:hypothetical protein KC330_g78 [Hortaea werneckii]